jgi:hypothetical protein
MDSLMIKYRWYEEIQNSTSLSQGDILFNCQIILPTEDVYNSLLEENYEPDAYNPVVILEKSIILSQACDLENGKIDSVVLCSLWDLKQLQIANDYYQSKKARESLRQGKEPAYHLLNKSKTENVEIDYCVVDFHRIYTVPKAYLKQIALNNKFRIRLLPPYREHLSQAFARYFMRVGLPVDISRDEIKKY